MSDRKAAENGRRMSLPPGVTLTPLATHPDSRGDLTEFFRNDWFTSSPLPVQWNVSRSKANVLRGVHVHALHWDYQCVLAGELVVGLHDLRPDALPSARTAMLVLNGERLQLLSIPPGVAHAFYSPVESVQVIGVSGYYNPSEDGRCRWDCPELGFAWPCADPHLSPDDRGAPSYAELRSAFYALTATPDSGALSS